MEEDNLRRAREVEAMDFRSQAFLDAMAEDIEWWVAGPPDLLPWAGTFRGREGVARFVETLYKHLKYTRWESFQWIAKSDEVIEFAHAAGHARATGRPYESDVVRVWTVREGKVVRVRSYYDTAAYARALRGTP